MPKANYTSYQRESEFKLWPYINRNASEQAALAGSPTLHGAHTTLRGRGNGRRGRGTESDELVTFTERWIGASMNLHPLANCQGAAVEAAMQTLE
eukprot:gene29353-36544_t